MFRTELFELFLKLSFALSISAAEIGLQNRNGMSTVKNSSSIESVMEKCNKTFQISAGDNERFKWNKTKNLKRNCLNFFKSI